MRLPQGSRKSQRNGGSSRKPYFSFTFLRTSFSCFSSRTISPNSVILNMILAPLLIFGIGPWPRLGVTGAALATFISILVADVLIVIYFEKKYHYLRFRFPLFTPQTKIWKRMLGIGVPAGTEFLLLFVYIVLVYAIIRGFGPEAQAGFGIGARVMQGLFLPVVALSFAVAPVV